MATQFLARSKKGLELFEFGDSQDPSALAQSLCEEVPRQCRFSASGLRLAFSLSQAIVVYAWRDGRFAETGREAHEVGRVPISQCVDFVLSPTGRYLAAYEKPSSVSVSVSSADSGPATPNLTFWRIEDDGSSRKIGGFLHKTQNTWMPQWTGDESHVSRMVSNEVQFFRAENLERVAFRIHADNIGAFCISPGPYPKAAVFIKEAKGMPGAVKVYLLPNTSAPVAQKAFYKADKCNILWSPTGRHLLALATTEVDSTGVSYYGETNLYFVSGDGSFDCRVELDKEGPIHDVAWSPRSDEFIVLYGYMPAKAMLFDNKCRATFEFPVGSKNHVRWNPQGSLICFGGFGNLPGHIEIWSRLDAIRRVGHCQSQGAALCEWSPAGTAFLTGTLTPRLRVDNNWKVWSWRGSLLGSTPYGELYQVAWRPMPSASFPAVDLSGVPRTASGPLETDVAAKKDVYRPPGLRHLQNARASSETPTAAPVAKAAAAAPIINPPSTLTKEEKIAKRLKEKLDQILLLKERRQRGETLELNQLDKIAKEDEVRQEYERALASIKP